MKKIVLYALLALSISSISLVHAFGIGFGVGRGGYYGRPGVSFGVGVGSGYYPYGYYGPYGGYYYGGPGISFGVGSDNNGYYDSDDYWDSDRDSYYE